MRNSTEKDIPLSKLLKNKELYFLKDLAADHDNGGFGIFGKDKKLVLGKSDFTENAEPLIINDSIYGYALFDKSYKGSRTIMEMLKYAIKSELIKRSLSSEILTHYRELTVISEINLQNSDNLWNYKAIGDSILNGITKLVPSDNMAIKLFNKNTFEFDIISTYGNCYKNVASEKLDEGIGGKVFFSGKPQILNNIEGELRCGIGKSVHSIICVPMSVGGKSIGVIEISSFNNREYTSYDLLILNNITVNTTLVIELSKLYFTERKLSEALKKERHEKNMYLNLSATDSLTGLHNRRKTMELFSQFIDIVKESSLELTVIMFDVDNFKTINDSLGHQIGDSVLKDLAAAVSGCIRKDAIFGRYGGDEFIIISIGVGVDETIPMLERVKGTLKNVSDAQPDIMDLMLNKVKNPEKTSDFKRNKQFTCSFGVAAYEKNDTVDSLIEKADKALLESKKRGKDRITVWEQGLA